MVRRRSRVLVAAAAAATLGVSAPAAFAVAPAPHVTVLSHAVAAPFQMFAAGAKLYVADGASGVISRLDGTTLTPVAKAAGVEGVAVDPRGDLAYTASDEATHSATLTIVHPDGSKVVAHLAGFEKAHNPDGTVTYGVLGKVSACVKKAVKKATGGGPVTYKGDVNSNPYAVTPFRNGWWLVADAGGNDILRVSPAGRVSVVSVIPRQATVITKAVAKANHFPACAIGVTYYSNPVPTDLQFGPNGALYVSTLSGGIAVGTVYTVDVRTGASRLVAGGFIGATNLAVNSNGAVYVTNAFAGTISRIYRGRTTTVAALANVLSLEFKGGTLYAGTAAPGLLQETTITGPGSLVKITF